MRKPRGFFPALLVQAALLAALVAVPASAQNKPGEATIKEIEQNDRVRVYEVIYKAGETLPSAKRPMRVVHAIQGGTLERTFEDGKKEAVTFKTGETKIINEEKPYALKYPGKGVIHLLIVAVK